MSVYVTPLYLTDYQFDGIDEWAAKLFADADHELRAFVDKHLGPYANPVVLDPRLTYHWVSCKQHAKAIQRGATLVSWEFIANFHYSLRPAKTQLRLL